MPGRRAALRGAGVSGGDAPGARRRARRERHDAVPLLSREGRHLRGGAGERVSALRGLPGARVCGGGRSRNASACARQGLPRLRGGGAARVPDHVRDEPARERRAVSGARGRADPLLAAAPPRGDGRGRCGRPRGRSEAPRTRVLGRHSWRRVAAPGGHVRAHRRRRGARRRGHGEDFVRRQQEVNAMYEPATATVETRRTGPWDPVTEEYAYDVTRITGEMPRELRGTLFRNGPSQRVEPLEGHRAMHLFDGDGLVHAFRIEDGLVRYTSRFVRDDSYLADERLGPSRFDFLNFTVGDPAPDAPLRGPHNTNVVWHHRRLMALVEADHPWELDPRTLESRGRVTFTDPPLGMAVTAHPKIDGRTGQMIIHGYQPFPPFVQLYTVEPDGRCSLAEVVDTPYSVMMHDLAITEHYVILLLCPVLFDIREGKPFRDW